MSKMDNLRAMREARHEKATKQPTQKASPRPRVSPKVEAAATAPPVEASDGLCGHRSISGRTCTREKGHTAKSHRYA